MCGLGYLSKMNIPEFHLRHNDSESFRNLHFNKCSGDSFDSTIYEIQDSLYNFEVQKLIFHT